MIPYSSFGLAVKSTIDYHAKQLANGLSLPFIDIASPEFETLVTESDQPAICWEFSSFIEAPRDPMFHIDFEIGAMTALDPAQYVSLGIAGAISNAFKIQTRIPIRDYSGVNAPTIDVGALYVMSNGMIPPQADKATGIRFVTVSAKVTRFT